MRFKYYLRGIGLGILFAVLIMIISIHNHKYDILSDDEIIEKAKELGMVTTEQPAEQINETENSTELSFGENVSTTEVYKVDTDNDANENTSEDVNSDKDTDKDNNTESQDTQTSESNSNEDEADYVIIKVEKGDVCRNISTALEELNIIEDAEDFRKYMGKKGYASSIHTGEFKIPKDATYDEIAKILIKK